MLTRKHLTRIAAAALAAATVSLTTITPARADDRVGGEIGYAYEYRYNGARGFLGNPITGEVRTPNNKGAYVAFQGGSIYWSPWTGAHETHGALRDGYGRLGWEGGTLGFPIGDEQTTSSRRGKYQAFEGGQLLWAPWSGAHELRGAIREEYDDAYSFAFGNYARAEDFLGFPITDEVRTPNGKGAYNAFQFGSIYWSPTTGAHEVHGALRDGYASQGWENGRLGFPTSDELDDYEGDLYQTFQGGEVWWAPGQRVEIFYY